MPSISPCSFFFFFNDTATTEIYTLSLHDALPIFVKYKFGHEVLNFRPYAGHMYGFARPHSGSVRIERLGASKSDTSISDVLVVWTAPRPRVGVVVVGWYKHARVYRKSQRLPASAHWRVKGHPIAYYVSAKAQD